MRVIVDKENVCWSKVGDETLLVNLTTGFYYTLDEIGGIMWELLLDQVSEDEIAEKIINSYDISKQKVIDDYRELVKKLSEERIVVIS